MSIHDFNTGGDFPYKETRYTTKDIEITYEPGRQVFLDLGCEIGTNIDPAGRKNWVFVMDEETPGWEYEAARPH